VQVEGTISWILPPSFTKVGKVHAWRQVSRAKAQSLRNPRGGTANNCMLPLALTAHEKQRSFRSTKKGQCKAFAPMARGVETALHRGSLRIPQ
jgi:hypothetical protein